MMVNIANPIYDSVFKYLMEDERIAKTLISALLKKDFDQSLKEKGNHQVLSVDEDKFNGDLPFISKPSRQLADNRQVANCLLTSSLRHPKIFVKEFSDFLMSCHQHCLGVNLFVQR